MQIKHKNTNITNPTLNQIVTAPRKIFLRTSL